MTSEVNIPDTSFWSGVTVVSAIVGWLLTLERRLNARLTVKKHSEICDKANAELDKKLEKILVTLDKQTENTQMHRQWMGDSIAHIRTQIAVIRDRMGDDPLKDDTGNFKRGSR
jgi:hypothetical protein